MEVSGGSQGHCLHPLTLISIFDHITRVSYRSDSNDEAFSRDGSKGSSTARLPLAMGLLFGRTQKGSSTREVIESREILAHLKGSDIFIDMEYLNHVQSSVLEVFPELELLGWYTDWACCPLHHNTDEPLTAPTTKKEHHEFLLKLHETLQNTLIKAKEPIERNEVIEHDQSQSTPFSDTTATEEGPVDPENDTGLKDPIVLVSDSQGLYKKMNKQDDEKRKEDSSSLPVSVLDLIISENGKKHFGENNVSVTTSAAERVSVDHVSTLSEKFIGHGANELAYAKNIAQVRQSVQRLRDHVQSILQWLEKKNEGNSPQSFLIERLIRTVCSQLPPPSEIEKLEELPSAMGMKVDEKKKETCENESSSLKKVPVNTIHEESDKIDSSHDVLTLLGEMTQDLKNLRQLMHYNVKLISNSKEKTLQKGSGSLKMERF
eukprot:g3705.t1